MAKANILNISDDEVFDLVEGGENINIFEMADVVEEVVVDDTKTKTIYHTVWDESLGKNVDTDKVRRRDTFTNDGSPSQRTEYDKDGFKSRQITYENGDYSSFTDTKYAQLDGKEITLTEQRKKNGELHGTQRKFFKGDLHKEVNYEDGSPKGSYKEYAEIENEDGTWDIGGLKYEGTYSGVRRKSKNVSTRDNDYLKNQAFDLNTHKTGESKSYYDDGSIQNITHHSEEQITDQYDKFKEGISSTNYRPDGTISSQTEILGDYPPNERGKILQDKRSIRYDESGNENVIIKTNPGGRSTKIFPNEMTDREKLSNEEFNDKYNMWIKNLNVEPQPGYTGYLKSRK